MARISDPAREEVFHQFGLRTVCPTNLGGSAMFTALTQPWEEKQVSFNTCTVSFHLHLADSSIIGRPLSDIPTEPGESITGVLHADDSASLYDGRQNIIIQKGDRIILSYVCD